MMEQRSRAGLRAVARLVDRAVRAGVRSQMRRRRLVSAGRFDCLEERSLLSRLVVTGSGAGALPVVHVFDSRTGAEIFQFLAYDARFRGGVRVAVGDVNGDGRPEIVTAPAGGAPALVKVFDGSNGTQLGQFLAAPPQDRSGVSIAVADVNGDGKQDIITGQNRGLPRVSVFEGPDGRLLDSFLAFGSFRGGVSVAAGDLNRDGHADIVTTPLGGPPVIRVFDGVTGTILSDYRAFPHPLRGGISVAVGDVNGDRSLDIIAAGFVNAHGPSADVKVFGGSSSTPLADFRVPGRQFAGGVRVAAVDLSGGHADELALAPARRGNVLVLDTSLLHDEALNPFDYSAGGRPHDLLRIGSQTPPVAFQVPADGRTGAFVAATSSVSESTPAALAAAAESPLSLSIPPIQRLALYDPATGQFTPVSLNDPRLVGKDVSVMVHGWAPGYLNWVEGDAALGQVLKWWQTFPGQPGYNPALANGLPPASEWLLDGHTEDSIIVAQNGMAQDLAARISSTDPNAAVLAFSWIDDSATPTSEVTGLPEDAYLSEAKTTLNGERLAVALEQALGTPAQFHGKLQLIGHSHGSKVATVAGVTLAQASYPVRQITVLDSPEDLLTDEVWATNNNWYFLQSANISHTSPPGTFVDNYISYFGEPYNAISYPGSNPNLAQVVDVQLFPEPYSVFDPGGQHSYAAFWYSGSSEPALTFGNQVGMEWSPLLPANTGPSNPPQNLSSSYEQSWNFLNFSQSNQFNLNTTASAAINPVFSPVVLTPTSSAPGVQVTNSATGATVALTQQGGALQSYTGSFTTSAHGIRGITFNYQFQNPAPGDVLSISIDGDLVFVMDASVVQATKGLGTISIGELLGSQTHTITFTLASVAPNASSGVTVNNFNQFYE